MANRQNVIIGIKFTPQAQVKSELNTIIAYLNQNSKIDLQFDTKKVTQSLNDFSKVLDNISSKIKSMGDIKTNSSGIIKDTEELKKEELAMEKVNKARQNMLNTSKTSSSVGVSDSLKSYDSLLLRAEEIRSTMQGISKINMSVKTNDEGVKKLNQAVIVYKNNLNQTVTETMKLYDVTNSKGKVVGSEFKSTGNLKISDNIEQQNKELEKQKIKLKEIEATKLKMTQNVSINKSDGILNTSSYDTLIAKIGKIDVTTPRNKIKELESSINNLGKSSDRVLTLTTTIDKYKKSVADIKANSSDALGMGNNNSKLLEYEANLKTAMDLLKRLKQNSETVTSSKFNETKINLGSSFDNLVGGVTDTKKQQLAQQKINEENAELYRANEVKKTKATQDEINKRKQLEQNYSDMYNRILNDRERANQIESEKQVQSAIKSAEKIAQQKNAMQGKLNNATQLNSMNNNSFIDPSVLTNLQNKLNSINTSTPEKEIKELQTVINNLGSSNSGIVKVQSAITKMEDGLANMKGKYGSLVGDSNSINQLRAYESEIGKLKTLLASLKSGDTISPIAITNATTQATTANRNLSTAIQTSSRAMRTGQQDAISFGDSMKKAFQNAGIYMSTYMVIQKVFREIKEGIQTVIEMDTALADLNKVVDLTKNQLNDMKESAINLGKELGQSATDVAQAMAEFGRLYKDTASIKEMTKVSVLGSNVMDNTSSAEVAKSLTTIMTAMKKEVGDSMGILDSMNEIKCVSPYIVIYK